MSQEIFTEVQEILQFPQVERIVQKGLATSLSIQTTVQTLRTEGFNKHAIIHGLRAWGYNAQIIPGMKHREERLRISIDPLPEELLERMDAAITSIEQVHRTLHPAGEHLVAFEVQKVERELKNLPHVNVPWGDAIPRSNE